MGVVQLIVGGARCCTDKIQGQGLATFGVIKGRKPATANAIIQRLNNPHGIGGGNNRIKAIAARREYCHACLNSIRIASDNAAMTRRARGPG
jgi:hypothetical protein